VRALQRAVDAGRARVERPRGLTRGEAEDVAKDEHGALTRRQMLERGDERELDALALLVAGLGARAPVLQSDAIVGIGLHPRRFDQRLARAVVRVGHGRVIDREHPLGPASQRLQAGVRGDRVQPRAKRAAPLEACQPAPGAEQRILERVLGVGN
jgi:hypothetical protein